MARITQEEYEAIPWEPVESSNIGRVAFHKTGTSTLDPMVEIGEMSIEFARDENTRVYTYANVPAALHADLIAASSVGSFFANNIRGRFEHERLEVEDDG